jgi:hypothetical protein
MFESAAEGGRDRFIAGNLTLPLSKVKGIKK